MKTETLHTVDENVVENTPSIRKTAAKAIKKGSKAAKQAAANVAFTPVKLVSHAVYGVCYGLSYGVVYSALVVGRVFPSDSVVSKALHDGSETAQKDFEAAHTEKVINPVNTPVNA